MPPADEDIGKTLPTFLGIPAEIRIGIYRLMFTGLKVQAQRRNFASVTSDLSDLLCVVRIDNKPPELQTAVMLACKTTYVEARPIFYESVDYFASDAATLSVMMDESCFRYARRHLRHLFDVPHDVFNVPSILLYYTPLTFGVTELNRLIGLFPSLRVLALDGGRVSFNNHQAMGEAQMIDYAETSVCPELSIQDLHNERPDLRVLVMLEGYIASDPVGLVILDSTRPVSAYVVDFSSRRVYKAWKLLREDSGEIFGGIAPPGFRHWPAMSRDTIQNLLDNNDDHLVTQVADLMRHGREGEVILGPW